MSSTPITWQDALLMPEDGKRYEAIDGELYVTPAPSRPHQRVSENLGGALRELLDVPGHGWVYRAPIGVAFPDSDEGVQPDIIFVSKARAELLVPEGIHGAPDLVVEIASPSTAKRDRTVKVKLYERQGVRVYWLVVSDGEFVDVWDLESGALEPVRYHERLPVVLGDQNFGVISLPEIFAPEI